MKDLIVQISWFTGTAKDVIMVDTLKSIMIMIMISMMLILLDEKIVLISSFLCLTRFIY